MITIANPPSVDGENVPECGSKWPVRYAYVHMRQAGCRHEAGSRKRGGGVWGDGKRGNVEGGAVERAWVG